MAVTLTQANDLVNDQTFLNRIKVAMTIAALDVIGEDGSGLTLPAESQFIEKRANLATSVLRDLNFNNYKSNFLSTFAYAVVASGLLSINADPALIPDNDIQFLVNSVWSDVAGVNFAELPT